tara:strand:- start:43 stop:351 length:309 start_codon:yes stop_codon:yes gene_type:complete
LQNTKSTSSFLLGIRGTEKAFYIFGEKIMNRILLGMLLAAFSAAGFAGNCSTHSKPMVSASDALKIEELQAEAKKAKADGNLALYEALMAQAKNVIQKRDFN